LWRFPDAVSEERIEELAKGLKGSLKGAAQA
jgi:hypothetical protein